MFRMTKQERIDLAITRAAKLQGEADAAMVEANYYEKQIASCDPHVDWWRFAHLKQKRADAQREYNQVAGHAAAAAEYVESLL